MKLLVFGDIHGSARAMREIRQKAKNAELIICIGDVTVFEQNFRGIMREIDSLGKKVLIVHGNHEDAAAMKRQCDETKNIEFMHQRLYEAEGYVFVGYGGGGFSAADNTMKKFFLSHKHRMIEGRTIIFTHQPPYKTALDNVYGSPCGSRTLRKIIEKIQPLYLFSGHLHENFGKRDKIKSTTIINPSPFGVMINLAK